MKYFNRILLLLIIVFSISCKDESHPVTCNVENPKEDLPWLKSMIQSWESTSTIYTYMYVQQGTYNGQTVFLAGNCCPFCDSYFPVFNCAGDELDGVNILDIKNLKVIWQPDGSQCSF